VGSSRVEHLEILTAMAGILQHLEQMQLLQLCKALSYCFVLLSLNKVPMTAFYDHNKIAGFCAKHMVILLT